MKLSATSAYISPTPVPKMPAGLVELMEGLTKEVLKNNSTDTYEFCAEHMRKLLELRDGRPPEKYLTLEQKIVKTTKIIRQRAEKRRQKYDSEVQYNLINSEKMFEEVHELDIVGLSKSENVSKLITNIDNSEFYTLKNKVEECNRDSGIVEFSEDNKDEHTNENMSHDEIIDEVFTDTNDYDHNEQRMKSDFDINNTKVEKNSIEDDLGNHDSNSTDNHKDSIICVDNSEALKLSDFIIFSKIEDTVNNVTHEEDKSNDKQLKVDDVKMVTENEELVSEIVSTIKNKGNDVLSAEDCRDNMEIVKDELDKYDEANARHTAVVDSNIEVNNSFNNINSKLDNSEIVEVHKDVYGNVRKTEESVVQLTNDEKKYLPIAQENATAVEADRKNDEEDSVANFVNEKIYSDRTNGDDLLVETGNIEIDGDKEVRKNQIGTEKKYLTATELTEVVNNYNGNENIEIKCISTHQPVTNTETEDNINETEQNQDDESQFSRDDNVSAITNIQENEFNNEGINEKKSNYDKFAISDVADKVNKTETHSVKQILPKRVDKNTDNTTCIFSQINYDARSSQQFILSESRESEDYNINLSGISEIKVIDIRYKNVENPLGVNIEHEQHGNGNNDDSIIIQNSSNTITNETQSNVESKMPRTMDLETAAITIQKVFRNFLFRSKTSSFDDSTNIEFNIFGRENDVKEEESFTSRNQNVNKDRRALGINRMDTVLQTVNEEKSLSLSTDDSSLSSAATVIQARIRGFLVRNRLNPNKTTSSTSLLDSYDPSTVSSEADPDLTKNKTVLNIHLVPQGSNFMSRDESLLTSVELSLDGSPPASTNLHPLSNDVSERRKQLKRVDAIQSVSPPSNNSRLSEEHDSVKEVLLNDGGVETKQKISNEMPIDSQMKVDNGISDVTAKGTIVAEQSQDSASKVSYIKCEPATQTSDESDVVTPFVQTEYKNSCDSDSTKLLHSGEFHDVVLPTKVSRSDTSVVRDFQNVLVYFLVWNNS